MTEDLSETLAASLETLIQTGFQSPLRVAGIAMNGIMFLLTLEPEGDHHQGQWQLEPSGDLTTPINVMIVDKTGNAARLVLKAGERPRLVRH